jgi:protein-S-isoprenylcysteine O-methyltransferase Ste14
VDLISRAIFDGACYLWAALALAVAPYLLLRPAPYGRHSRAGWGPTLNARLAWVLMEAPSPILMVAFFTLGRSPRGSIEAVFLGMWLSHYLYRAFAFPLLLPSSSRPMPLAIVVSGAFFNLVNASLNGAWLFSLSPARPAAWLASPAFMVGGAMFVGGFLAHVLVDRHLRRLRRENGGARGVPRSWLFRFVSCPNYLGEIVEWTGFALATWSPSGLLFALWTAANLVPRAIHHHRWYRANFADYPPKRRAVVPFVL